MSDARIRPMRAEDVAAAERLTNLAYGDDRDPSRAALWRDRTAHLVGTDSGGCWVAEVDGRSVGVAVSFRRELMWVLASFAVAPDAQGHGVGKALLAVAQEHGKGCLRSLLASSDDPRATRRYQQAGFTLHPQMVLSGVVDRSVLPVVDHVRAGSESDVALLDSIDRRTRGAAHGPDHVLLLAQDRLLVRDRPSTSGYAYVRAGGEVSLLAATDRRTAAALLWEALAGTEPGSPTRVRHVTAANAWAVDVAMQARLDLGHDGYLGVRGLKPPAPYLHHGSLL